MVSIMENFVVISTDEKPTHRNSWCTQALIKDNMKWVTCDKNDAKFNQFVGKKYDMLDELQRLRNKASEELMQKAEDEEGTDDPLAEEADDVCTPKKKKAKKEVFDTIPGYSTSNCKKNHPSPNQPVRTVGGGLPPQPLRPSSVIAWDCVVHFFSLDRDRCR